MSITLNSNITNNIQINPNKEARKNFAIGALCKVAAVTTLVAYTALSIVATVAVGIYAPIYLPIELSASLIFADLVYKQIFTRINAEAENRLEIAKQYKGVVEELNKLDDKKDFHQAKINYLEKYIITCEKEKSKHLEKAQKAILNPKKIKTLKNALNLAGQWQDKLLNAKLNLAYNKVLKIDPKYSIPMISKINFIGRSYVEKLLKDQDIVLFQNGKGLSVAQLEQLDSSKIADIMLPRS